MKLLHQHEKGGQYKTQKLHRTLPYLLAFLLPIIIFFLIFHIQAGGLWPFGRNTILTIDAEGQYVPFFSQLRSIIFGNNDFSYNFNNIIGGDFFGLAAYYLFSPFNLIYLLIKTETIAFLVVSLLKVGAMGFFAFLFLTRHFKQKPSYKTIIFSTAYALMLYSIAFYSNTMFMDGLVFLPLVWMGVDKMLRTGKASLYIFSLGAILCAQYYMAYIICIGTTLYFIYMFLQESPTRQAIKANLAKIRQFFFTSIVAAILSAFILLPAFMSILTSERRVSVPASSTVVSLTQYSAAKPLLQFFGFWGGRLHTLYSPAFTFCGIITAFLVIAFFISRRIRAREKILSAAIILLFLLSFASQPLDYIWHGFSTPNGFSFRQAFILVLFLIIMAYKYCLILQEKKFFRKKLVLFSLGFANIASLFLMGVLVTHNTVTDGAHYIRNHQELNEMISDMRSATEKMHEKYPGEYRVEKSFQYTENDPILFGYNGLTHYSSSVQHNTMSLVGKRLFFTKMERVGLATIYKNTMTSSIDSLFGVRFFFKDYEYNTIERGISVFENKYALPMAFMADKDLLLADTDNLEYFELQNKMFSALSGIDTPIFTATEIPIEGKGLSQKSTSDGKIIYEGGGKYAPGYLRITAPIDDDDKIYYFDFVWNSSLEVRINNKPFDFAYDDLTGEVPEPPLLLTDKYDSSSEQPVEIEIPEEIELKSPSFYQESKSALGEHYAALADEPCDLAKISSSHLTCTVTAKTDGNLFFSIPNDKGWVVKVDNKKVKTETALDLFMTIPLTAGTHNIEMKYTPRGFWTGAFISVIAIIACAIYGIRAFWRQTSRLLTVCALSSKNKKHHQCFH
jgi:uncharacterized membrane protein YfhO